MRKTKITTIAIIFFYCCVFLNLKIKNNTACERINISGVIIGVKESYNVIQRANPSA
jgi:hypothetical protein